MRHSSLLLFFALFAVSVSANPVINQITVDGPYLRIFGESLVSTSKDRVYIAIDGTNEVYEPQVMTATKTYVEVYLETIPPAGQYRLFINKNEKSRSTNALVIFGAIGPQGPEGPRGPQGLAGADGVDGASGADGQNGALGAAGPQGPPGAIGATGSAGPAGAAGPAGTDGSSCSVGQEGNVATISCDDGTQATIAGAGTTIVLPDGGIFGEPPAFEYPSGTFVLADAAGVVVSRYDPVSPFEGPWVPVNVDNLTFIFGNNEVEARVEWAPASSASSISGSLVFSLPSEGGIFLEPGCSGLRFLSPNSLILTPDGEYLAGMPGGQQLLYESVLKRVVLLPSLLPSETWQCVDERGIAYASPAVQYSPPAFWNSLTYPLSVQSLP